MRHLFIFLLALSGFLYADAIKAVNDRINFENQKNVYKKLQHLKNQKIPFYNTNKPQTSFINKDQKCFYIKNIDIKGITLLSKQEQNKVLKSYINHCDTLQDIKDIINKLNALYMDKGYITSRVYIKPQNLSKGVLKLFSIEGRIDKIKPDKLYIKDVFLGQKGEVLDLRKIEDAIELINRIPSNHASLDIKPSKKRGYSDIVIKNKTSKRVNGSIEVDNYGSKKTGRIQGSFTFGIDDVFGINDRFDLVLNGTDKEFTDENANGDSISFSFPTGRVLNDFSYSKTSYRQFVPADIVNYKINGDTQTLKYSLSYGVFHNLSNSIKITTTVSHSKNRNYIENTLIQTSSYSLSNIDFDINFLHNLNDFYITVSLDYKKGTKWFGTHNPTELNPRFALYDIDISFQKKFSFFDYSLQAHYQYTKDKLFSNFRIAVGGAYSVRGYENEGLSGNNGYYFRNEFIKHIRSRLFNYLHYSCFIALDGGHIKKESDSNAGDLLSYVAGMRFGRGGLTGMVYFANPIYKDVPIHTKSFAGFKLEYKF